MPFNEMCFFTSVGQRYFRLRHLPHGHNISSFLLIFFLNEAHKFIATINVLRGKAISHAPNFDPSNEGLQKNPNEQVYTNSKGNNAKSMKKIIGIFIAIRMSVIGGSSAPRPPTPSLNFRCLSFILFMCNPIYLYFYDPLQVIFLTCKISTSSTVLPSNNC
jgi:hypothetical protein